MNRSRLALVALLLGLAVAPLPTTSASASCVAPYLEDTDGLALTPGSSVTVEGRAFVDGCRDTMTCTGVLGCERCEYDEPPPRPLEAVALRLVQGDRTWRLGTADASTADDRQGRVSWTFDVPSGVRPGPARLVADGAEPVRVEVRR